MSHRHVARTTVPFLTFSLRGGVAAFQRGVDTVIPESPNETQSSSFSHTIPGPCSQSVMLSGKAA